MTSPQSPNPDSRLPLGQTPHGYGGYPPPGEPDAPPAGSFPPRGPHAGREDLGQPLSNMGEILSNITEDLSTLVRQETDLAKAELKQSATRAGKSAGMFGGTAVAGHMALLFLTIALWWGIAHLINSFGWAAFIVGVLWGIAAAVMAAMGRKEMNSIKGLPRTTETAAKIPDALKGNEHTHV